MKMEPLHSKDKKRYKSSESLLYRLKYIIYLVIFLAVLWVVTTYVFLPLF